MGLTRVQCWAVRPDSAAAPLAGGSPGSPQGIDPPFSRCREAEANQKCLGPRGQQQPPGERCPGAGSAPPGVLGVRGHGVASLCPWWVFGGGSRWGTGQDLGCRAVAFVGWEGIICPSVLSPLSPCLALVCPALWGSARRPPLCLYLSVPPALLSPGSEGGDGVCHGDHGPSPAPWPGPSPAADEEKLPLLARLAFAASPGSDPAASASPPLFAPSAVPTVPRPPVPPAVGGEEPPGNRAGWRGWVVAPLMWLILTCAKR